MQLRCDNVFHGECIDGRDNSRDNNSQVDSVTYLPNNLLPRADINLIYYTVAISKSEICIILYTI